jgi:hypothetical protein
LDKEWARSALQQLIRRAYQLKDRFSESQQDELAEMLTKFRHSQQSKTLGNIKSDLVSDKIKVDGLAFGSD